MHAERTHVRPHRHRLIAAVVLPHGVALVACDSPHHRRIARAAPDGDGSTRILGAHPAAGV